MGGKKGSKYFLRRYLDPLGLGVSFFSSVPVCMLLKGCLTETSHLGGEVPVFRDDPPFVLFLRITFLTFETNPVLFLEHHLLVPHTPETREVMKGKESRALSW